MKKLASLLITLGLAAVLAAQTVTESLQRIQSDPASNTAQAFFEKKITVSGQTYAQPWTSVQWDTTSTKTVTVSGKTMTYAEVSAFIVAIANQENADQAAAAAATPPAPNP